MYACIDTRMYVCMYVACKSSILFMYVSYV